MDKSGFDKVKKALDSLFSKVPEDSKDNGHAMIGIAFPPVRPVYRARNPVSPKFTIDK
ncbi:MAG: hypothetical protein ACRCYD_01895 [Plesiomonas sp.]